MSKKEQFKRWSVLCIAFIIQSFGIDVVTDANLGTSPISSVPLVLSIFGGLTFGQYTFLLNMCFLLGQRIVLGRKGFHMAQLMQIPVVIIFSAFIDICRPLSLAIAPHFYPLQVVMCVLGCALIALSICIEVTCRLTVVPGEGLVIAITHVFKHNLGNVKILFDVSLVTLGIVLSLLLMQRIAGFREGTIISAILVGTFVKLFSRISKPLVHFFST